MKFILGSKLGMSQRFDQEGNLVPVTLIEAGPCYVTQVKTEEKDGYRAVQLGFKEKNKLNKPQEGHLKEKKLKFLREFRTEEEFKVNDEIKASVFEKGEKVRVAGVSKGKGFAGAVKRWGFSLQPATHGTKDTYRSVGSIGSAFPQRVIKGRKMPGRKGSERIKVKNLEVIEVDPKEDIIAVKGAVPGRKGALLEIYGG